MVIDRRPHECALSSVAGVFQRIRFEKRRSSGNEPWHGTREQSGRQVNNEAMRTVSTHRPGGAVQRRREGGVMQIDARPEDVGLSTPRLARVSEWMRRWVDSGRFPGLLVAVVRDDRLAWFETFGRRDVESGQPVEPDTIYRIYSMTKPITTVAALMLYEEGRFQLDDPVDRFIPAFAGTRVFAGGDADSFTTVPLARPITVHDLMVHTSGLTYGFQHEHAVDAL